MHEYDKLMNKYTYVEFQRYIHKYEGKIRWVSYIFKRRDKEHYMFFTSLGQIIFSAVLEIQGKFDLCKKEVHFNSKNEAFKFFTTFNKILEKDKRLKEITNKIIFEPIYFQEPELFKNFRWQKNDLGSISYLKKNNNYWLYEAEIYCLFKYLHRLVQENPDELYLLSKNEFEKTLSETNNLEITNDYLDVYFSLKDDVEFWQDFEFGDGGYFINFCYNKKNDELLFIFQSNV